MGKMHASCYLALPDTKVVGVCDILPQAAENAAKLVNARIMTADEIMQHPDIDAVNICLPTYLHKTFTIKALRAGRHVFCEKPMALSVPDAEEMIKEAGKARKKLMMGMVLRFWPEFVKIKEMVVSGKHGKILQLFCFRVANNPSVGSPWFGDVKKSGGILDLHIHDTDFIYFLLGKPTSVVSQGFKTGKRMDHISTIYEYPGKAVTANSGWNFPAGFGFSSGYLVLFSDGTCFEFNRLLPLTQYDDKKQEVKLEALPVGQVNAGGNISSLGGYYLEMKYWVDCLRQNKDPEIITPEDARNSLDITLKEIKSAETGRKIRI